MTAETSIIYLLDKAAGTAVEAELRDAIEEAQLVDWQTKWQPALIVVLQELARQQVPISKWPQSWHWDWRAKMTQVTGLLAFRGFCVLCTGVTRGAAAQQGHGPLRGGVGAKRRGGMPVSSRR